MAVAFAEMHDTPVRMMAKKVLHGIVPWQKARSFLAIRLKRRYTALPGFVQEPIRGEKMLSNPLNAA